MENGAPHTIARYEVRIIGNGDIIALQMFLEEGGLVVMQMAPEMASGMGAKLMIEAEAARRR